MYDENRPIPHVEIKQPDQRPRCWHCGRLLGDERYNLKHGYHNQCIIKKANAPLLISLQEQEPPKHIDDFMEYIDKVMQLKPQTSVQ